MRRAGNKLVDRATESDLVVINTCTVTAAAAADSRAKARRAHRDNSKADILLTGCWSTLEPESARALPGVVKVVPNGRKGQLVGEYLNLPQEMFEREPLARRPLPGSRRRTRAFLKVQDGCDNRCTFCLTTVARGPSQSLPPDRILAEVLSAQEGGAQEVVLSGVQLSSYGREFTPPMDLKELIRYLLKGSDVPRIRLSSIEPWGLTPDFFELWSNPRLCRHLHLPLQAGCDRTLRRMGRPITTESFARLVAHARHAIPGLAVSTDLIVGFPGESEVDFKASKAFVQNQAFSDAHVFTYSPRPDTAAVRLPGRVPSAIAKERSNQMRRTTAETSRAFQTKWIGEEVQVLWESLTAVGASGWRMHGRTDNNLLVQAWCEQQAWNRIAHVKLTGLSDRGVLQGDITGFLER